VPPFQMLILSSRLLSTAVALSSDSTACRLLLVRHGETNFNADGRMQGRLESTLTEAGHAQALAVGKWLAHADISTSIGQVFVSPRKRTRQTLAHVEAEHHRLNHGLPSASVRSGLREIELTAWEGQSKSDLRDSRGNSDAERWAQWKAHPDGFVFEEDGHSPLGDLKRRAKEEWAALVDGTPMGTTSLVVAHGAFNRALMQTALGLPVDDIGFRDDRFAFDNCATVELLWQAGTTNISAWRKRYPSKTQWFTRQEELERRAMLTRAVGDADQIYRKSEL
jgi:broad specificity phosphatase PhoE